MRPLHLQDLVSLPHLSARETVTLATQLEIAASEYNLQGESKEALADVAKARKELSAALRAHRELDAQQSPAAVAADHELDRAWAATSKWLAGWVQLDDATHSKIATALNDVLFPDGVEFLNLKYMAEWAESEQRLMKVRDKRLEHAFDTLGGRSFLDTIKQAHAHYGEVLGVDSAHPAPPAIPNDLRAAMDEAQSSLAEYAGKIVASVSRKKPETAKIAETLLAPIASFISSKNAPTHAPPAM
jgi:hypothetical protein